MPFQRLQNDRETAARLGRLDTPHGTVHTPVFMPVGTRATVKGMTPRDLEELGCEILLGNTYHLALRPGIEIVEDAGGLHRFMHWRRPILTDSGGYQVFSLAALRKVTSRGVHFQSHIDGTPLFLGPSEAMDIQRRLGSDIAMVFDECTHYPCTRDEAQSSLALTLAWARECRKQPRAEGQQVFGIVQGALFRDLREHAARELAALDFDGYAVGGLSVGEEEKAMLEVLDWTTPLLPADRARYLMGVGTPPQIVRAVARGVDMFDCVLPTRLGRNGTAFTAEGSIPVKAGRFRRDFRPVDESCSCYACRHFSRAYIRHLINMNEMLAARLLTLHNLHFYLRLMETARRHIRQGTFAAFAEAFCQRYDSHEPENEGAETDHA